MAHADAPLSFVWYRVYINAKAIVNSFEGKRNEK